MQPQQNGNSGTCSPQIWAIGGGKGGIGKSVLSILIAMALAEKGEETVVIDGDLGGANLHTFMGIRTPGRTLNDFIDRRDTFTSIGHRADGLCAAQLKDMLDLANMRRSQDGSVRIWRCADHDLLHPRHLGRNDRHQQRRR